MDRELLERIQEYLEYNIPTNGWGLLDNGAQADRVALLVRVRAALQSDTQTPENLGVPTTRGNPGARGMSEGSLDRPLIPSKADGGGNGLRCESARDVVSGAPTAPREAAKVCWCDVCGTHHYGEQCATPTESTADERVAASQQKEADDSWVGDPDGSTVEGPTNFATNSSGARWCMCPEQYDGIHDSYCEGTTPTSEEKP